MKILKNIIITEQKQIQDILNNYSDIAEGCPATGKQIWFIAKLLAEKAIAVDEVVSLFQENDDFPIEMGVQLSKADANEILQGILDGKIYNGSRNDFAKKDASALKLEIAEKLNIEISSVILHNDWEKCPTAEAAEDSFGKSNFEHGKIYSFPNGNAMWVHRLLITADCESITRSTLKFLQENHVFFINQKVGEMFDSIVEIDKENGYLDIEEDLEEEDQIIDPIDFVLENSHRKYQSFDLSERGIITDAFTIEVQESEVGNENVDFDEIHTLMANNHVLRVIHAELQEAIEEARE